MNDSIKLLHLVAAIIWMGGMAFMLLALRPAVLDVMEPQPRARLMAVVWRRFFRVVWVAIGVLLLTGGPMYAAMFRTMRETTGTGSVPLGWSLMMVIGLAMMAIFGHIYFAGLRKFLRALAAGEGAQAAKAASQIHTLVLTNFVLGWLAIAAVRLVH